MLELKTIKVTKAHNSEFQSLAIQIPFTCPHCEDTIHPLTREFQTMNYNESQRIHNFLHNCPSCLKNYLTTHLRDKNSITTFVNIYPSTKVKAFDQNISELSPRFADVYNQASTAENNNHFEVAGSGYRLALEILIKDFAIKHLKEPEKEVSEMKLFKAIETYSKNQALHTSAEVVRKLGNSYTHYINKHDDVEFAHLKWYLDAFISEIEFTLKMSNPPVPTRQFQQESSN